MATVYRNKLAFIIKGRNKRAIVSGHQIFRMKTIFFVYMLISVSLLSGCDSLSWNNPYPASESVENIYYDSFSERPKHLDPVSSYSENEATIIGQIYEPPLQYHFLKRPYELIPLSATAVPKPVYYDKQGNELPVEAAVEKIARVVYRISINKNVLYQPHPAFARDEAGNFLYHNISEADLDDVYTISDFPVSGARELIAEDFVYQIKRLVKPGVHSPLGGLMSRYILDLAGLAGRLQASKDDFIDLRDYAFAGAEVIDRYTYEIHLNQKYPQFVFWLSMYFFSPVAWEVDKFYSQTGFKDKNITLDWYPVGSGPYMLVSNNPNRHMILQRNPNFHGETYPDEGEPGDREAGFLDKAGQRMPFIDKAYYALEKEAIPEWNKFLQGYFDTSGIQSDSFDQAIQFTDIGDPELTPVMKEKGIRLLTAVSASTSYMGFNMKDEVVGGDSERARLLRHAISIVVDYEELISIFANGRGIPAQGPIPPGIFGYVEGEAGINPYVYIWEDQRPKRKSIEEARALLVQAGYSRGRDVKSGKPLVLFYDTVSAGAGSKSILNWYMKQFEKLGIQLVIRATDYNRFQEKMRKGTAQIFSWGWNADYPDPENFLFLLLGENTKVDHNGENAANYKNQEFDELFVKMRSIVNGPERQAVIDRMVEIVQHDAPWSWGFHPKGYSLYHSWYGNAKPNLMARNKLKYKTIDFGLRAEMRNKWNRPIIWPVIVLFMIFLLSLIPAVVTFYRRQRKTIT